MPFIDLTPCDHHRRRLLELLGTDLYEDGSERVGAGDNVLGRAYNDRAGCLWRTRRTE
jgi:hypothetical protein